MLTNWKKNSVQVVEVYTDEGRVNKWLAGGGLCCWCCTHQSRNVEQQTSLFVFASLHVLKKPSVFNLPFHIAHSLPPVMGFLQFMIGRCKKGLLRTVNSLSSGSFLINSSIFVGAEREENLIASSGVLIVQWQVSLSLSLSLSPSLSLSLSLSLFLLLSLYVYPLSFSLWITSMHLPE